MSNPVDLRALLGRNLERLRFEGAATHDDLARAAHVHGLEWPEEWFAGVEHGARPLSAEELVALPIVLAEALGHAVGLADLLLGDEPIRLAAGPAAVLPAAVRDVLTTPVQRRAFAAGHPPGEAPEASALARAAERMRHVRNAGLGDVDVRALARAEEGAGEREARLARRLGVPPVVVAGACAALWGRSLTEERAARLSDGSAPSPAAVMRRLTAAIARQLTRTAATVRDEAAPDIVGDAADQVVEPIAALSHETA